MDAVTSLFNPWWWVLGLFYYSLYSEMSLSHESASKYNVFDIILLFFQLDGDDMIAIDCCKHTRLTGMQCNKIQNISAVKLFCSLKNCLCSQISLWYIEMVWGLSSWLQIDKQFIPRISVSITLKQWDYSVKKTTLKGLG